MGRVFQAVPEWFESASLLPLVFAPVRMAKFKRPRKRACGMARLTRDAEIAKLGKGSGKLREQARGKAHDGGPRTCGE